MSKQILRDKAMFRGFIDKVLDAADDDADDEIMIAHGLLNPQRTGPAKDERVPGAGYSRGEQSRILVDNVLAKAAT